MKQKIKRFNLPGFRDKKLIALFLVLFISILAVPITTKAYVLEGWKMSSTSMSYTWGDRLQTSGTVIREGWEDADSDWYTASSINFYTSSSSANILNSFYESSSTLYGRTTISTNSSDIVTSFVGRINAGNSDISDDNVARSTGVHEFGHIIGLDDRTSGTAIMNVNRDRTVVYTPRTDDENGVSAIYD